MVEIAVVIPCYNHAHFLLDAIGSVYSQTRLPCRVVVVNDGSTDDTFETVECFERAARPTRFVYIELHGNRGLGAARNAGICAVPFNSWVVCLDADDALVPGALERIAAAAAERWHHGAHTMGPNLVTFPLEDFDGGRVWNPPASIDLEKLESRNLFPYCAAFPLRLWSDVGGYDEGECARLGINDWEFWQRAHRLVGLRPVVVDAPLVRYRQHAGPRLSDQFKDRPELVRAALARAKERSRTRQSAPHNSSGSVS